MSVNYDKCVLMTSSQKVLFFIPTQLMVNHYFVSMSINT